MHYFQKFNQFALFKCKHNSKEPATKHGYHDSEFNADYVKWVEQGYNIGIDCKKSEVIVFDLDVDEERGLNGIEAIHELEKELGDLPQTLTQTTPRGGKHLFFSSVGVINPIGKIGKDIDIKYNGYVLSEPSNINGKAYKILYGVEGNKVLISKLPQKWLNYINRPKKQQYTFNSCTQKTKNKVISGDFDKIYENCLFIKNCVDNAKNLSEPEWHIFACVLNNLENGEELFVKYSQTYPKYNPAETKRKFRNAQKYNVTCNTISNFFEKCNICKYNKENQNGKF